MNRFDSPDSSNGFWEMNLAPDHTSSKNQTACSGDRRVDADDQCVGFDDRRAHPGDQSSVKGLTSSDNRSPGSDNKPQPDSVPGYLRTGNQHC